jgi:hypothetical protein
MLTPGGSRTVHKQYIERHNETEYTEQNIHQNRTQIQNRTYIAGADFP